MASPPPPSSLKPPFTPHTAHLKVKAGQALWNTRDPARVIRAYTPDCIWRNRDTFVRGHEEIKAFLAGKWEKEREYRLRKELFAVDASEGGKNNKIAVQFWYEYAEKAHPDYEDGPVPKRWRRCYGLEHWTFNAEGVMEKRMMSGNEIEIGEEERWFKDGVDVDSVVLPEGHF